MWAEFWIILLAVALVIAAWCIYLLERERRKERRGRLAWKREFYAASGLPEPHVSGSDHG